MRALTIQTNCCEDSGMSEVPVFLFHTVDTPIGKMAVVSDVAGKLRGADWVDHLPRMLRLLNVQYGENGFRLEKERGSNNLTRVLKRYFAGELKAIDGLPVETGGTPFQRAVWAALRTVPAGATITYRQLAERVGRPTAIRAAGTSNGANPVSVVIPCHRVIGANGSLTGYGGGMERKAWLLKHEGAQSASMRMKCV
jgi:methylated-DNA-[protein]-cysteine S-methyltransferase